MITSKNQKQVIQKIRKKLLQKTPKYNYFKRNGIYTTIVSNSKKININELKKKGFLEIEIQNDEGFFSHCLYKFHSADLPFLIFIAGVGLSVTMDSFNNFAIPLDEKKLFNIVLIENPTSGDWILRNKSTSRLIASGYEAGWNLYLTIKSLKKFLSTIDVIQSTHLIGLSLGGNDAVYCSYFDSILETNIIDGSVMAWSSPTDRFIGLDHYLYCSGMIKNYIKILFDDIYTKGETVFHKYTQKKPAWVFDSKTNTKDFLREFFHENAFKYFREYTHHFEIDQRNMKKIHLTHPQDLNNLENYLSLFSLQNYLNDITKPLLWIHSFDDPVVKFDHNIKSLNGFKLPRHIDILPLEYGGHMGFPSAYSVDWIVETITLYINYWNQN